MYFKRIHNNDSPYIPGTWLLSCGLLMKLSWNGLTLAFAATGTNPIGVNGIAVGFRLELRVSSFAKLGVSSSIGPVL